MITKKQRVETLIKEYQRAVIDPIYDEPERYCLILDLIADELERLGYDPKAIAELVDFANNPY